MTDGVRIHRLRLRDPSLRREAVTSLLADADWPATAPGETLILRRLHIAGRLDQLGVRAAVASRTLIAEAVSGTDPRAADAAAVRFASRAELLACLVADLLTGQAAARWYWRGFAELIALGRVQAAVRALAREPLELPAVAQRLTSSQTWPRLWSGLGEPEAAALLLAIERETGWRVHSTPNPPPESISTPAPTAELLTDPALAAELSAIAAGVADRRRRLRLALTLDLWRRAPALLGMTGGVAGIERRLLAWMGSPPARSHPIPGGDVRPRPVARRNQGQDGSPSRAGLQTDRDPTQARTGSGIAGVGSTERASPGSGRDDGVGDGAALCTPVAAEDLNDHQAPSSSSPTRGRPGMLGESDGPDAVTAPHHPAPARPEDRTPPASQVHQPSQPLASPAPRPTDTAPGTIAEHRIVTLQGGLFYLLNLMDLPNLRPLLALDADPDLALGWVRLHQLGRGLGYEPDPPLARILAEQAGLADVALLDALPAPAGLQRVLTLGERRCGPIWGPPLCALPALVQIGRSHLDLQLRLADVRLSVRRLGLDIDPGWLPWLGRVVAFHYGHPPELAGLDGAEASGCGR